MQLVHTETEIPFTPMENVEYKDYVQRAGIVTVQRVLKPFEIFTYRGQYSEEMVQYLITKHVRRKFIVFNEGDKWQIWIQTKMRVGGYEKMHPAKFRNRRIVAYYKNHKDPYAKGAFQKKVFYC